MRDQSNKLGRSRFSTLAINVRAPLCAIMGVLILHQSASVDSFRADHSFQQFARGKLEQLIFSQGDLKFLAHTLIVVTRL